MLSRSQYEKVSLKTNYFGLSHDTKIPGQFLRHTEVYSYNTSGETVYAYQLAELVTPVGGSIMLNYSRCSCRSPVSLINPCLYPLISRYLSCSIRSASPRILHFSNPHLVSCVLNSNNSLTIWCDSLDQPLTRLLFPFLMTLVVIYENNVVFSLNSLCAPDSIHLILLETLRTRRIAYSTQKQVTIPGRMCHWRWENSAILFFPEHVFMR